MRLICYRTSGEAPRIVTAPVERDWMDRTANGFAYRCLPLNIANSHGWMILNSRPFVATWTGGSGLDALAVQATGEGGMLLAGSHFGNGILTFNVNGLFRTEPGYDLMVCGPLNRPKDAIQPLTGIVETDWAPYTFTMNWRFTRKLAPVAFDRDEPFCMIFPVKRGLVEEAEPEIRDLASDPELEREYRTFAESRRKFNADLKVPGSEAVAQQWQKHYFRGTAPSGDVYPDHRTRVRVREFTPG